MKLGKCLEFMKVLLSLLVLLYKYVISFLPKIQVFTKETKIAVAVAYNRWQLWKKVFEKFKPNPWKKKLWRSSFLVTLQARHLQIYQQINSSTGIFQGKCYLFSSYLLYHRIPRIASFQNIFQWLLLKIAYSLLQRS